MLAPSDWRSGDRFWLIEVVAPYGQGSGPDMIHWLKEHLPESVDRFRFARVGRGATAKRIVESRRLVGARWGARVLRDGQAGKASASAAR